MHGEVSAKTEPGKISTSSLLALQLNKLVFQKKVILAGNKTYKRRKIIVGPTLLYKMRI